MRFTRHDTLMLLPFIASACASTGSTPWSSHLRPARDTPVQFVTEDGTVPEDSCMSPLVDPRDQARIRMVRSAATGATHLGDYEVPAGRYGVGTGELLRVDCGTGQALGIVPDQ